eukprot:CAMPEP_0177761212 /NCGR_PEP_ID=MMETSP0491_2-20121128/5683_1 /TAXON_ID=63592 /ORGANISM="Tetraselmis chuii, Strain PLY429" /LENGTH=498 /DNA_ID=CAMNT_0019277169 /DNA_START=63 /DNA_END=1559 /DNA_ORIENTATION=-
MQARPYAGNIRTEGPKHGLVSKGVMRRTTGSRVARVCAGRGVVSASAAVSESRVSSVGAPGVLSVKEHHHQLRAKVVSMMPEGSVIYLEGGEAVRRNGMDVFYDYRPDSDFFYLTGCAEPGFGALIDTVTGKYTLLSAKVPDEMLHWVGALPTLEQLAEEYGADDCAYMDDAPRLLKACDAPVIHSLPDKIGDAAEEAITAMRGMVNTSVLPKKLMESREFKSGSEIACLQVASDVSSDAHRAVIRAARGTSFEYQLQSVFLNTTVGAGLKHVGYPAIIGAGRNSAILHYDRNNGPIQPHDVVLMDAGSEYRCYTADITRTFPAGGRFSPEMADVYDAVLAIQTLALEKIRPGASWEEVTMDSRRLLAQLLLDLKLTKGSVDAIVDMGVDKLFMPHGLGHFLGLDVHDMDGGGNPIPSGLLPGHVVTCEPGMYFVDSLLEPALADGRKAELLNADRVRGMFPFGGVRIEDNVAIMAESVHNLTSVPKTRADIEELARS